MIVKRGESLGLDWQGAMADMQQQDWPAAMAAVTNPSVQTPSRLVGVRGGRCVGGIAGVQQRGMPKAVAAAAHPNVKTPSDHRLWA